jgi:hypothetical protein
VLLKLHIGAQTAEEPFWNSGNASIAGKRVEFGNLILLWRGFAQLPNIRGPAVCALS